jgi:imidazolonepropionase-like amidohydrolase
MMKKIYYSLLICAFSVHADVIIHAGHLFDAVTGEFKTKQSIVIDKNKIKAVESGFIKIGKEDQYIDLKEAYVMPGLMDAHVHLAQEYQPKAERDVAMESEYATLYAAANARKTVEAGFTTVRNLGDGGMQTISLRKAIARGLLVGPRIVTSGKTLATTGGHGDPTNGKSKNDYSPPSPEDGVIDSYDDAKKAVRQRYKDGVDGIKITATGGVLSVAKSGQNPQFMKDELAGIIETAQDYGLWVAAHAHGTEGIIRAVEAGVNSIEHGTYLDEVGMDLMITKGTYYVPTIMAGEWVAEKAKIDNFFPELVRPKAASIGPQIQSTFAKAYKRGVKIAFGTDSGVSPHGDNWQEFVLMVEAGMPAAEAIQSATIETAKLFRLDDVLGQIKANYLADIVATNEDPTKNISVLGNIAFVMKDGEIIKEL